jgi:hypothetical protein
MYAFAVVSARYMSRSRTVGLYDKYIFSLIRNLQIVF